MGYVATPPRSSEQHHRQETIGWFLLAERVAEVHIKAPDALPITDQAAFIASAEIGHPSNAAAAYEYAIMSHIPDPSVVD